MMVLHLCLSICNMIAVMNIRLWTFFVLDNSYVPLKIIYGLNLMKHIRMETDGTLIHALKTISLFFMVSMIVRKDSMILSRHSILLHGDKMVQIL